MSQKKVTIQFFAGCPNHPPVMDMVERLIARHGLRVDLDQVEVAPADVERIRFLGSPTVLVDGVDIEPGAHERTEYALTCRKYPTPNGLPDAEMLLQALGRD